MKGVVTRGHGDTDKRQQRNIRHAASSIIRAFSFFIPPPSSFILTVVAFLLSTTLAPLSGALAQSKQQPGKSGTNSSQSHESSALGSRLELIERAMSAVCTERKRDPLGSMPIDEMQSHPSLPLTSPKAVAGAQRAERLLPVAQELAVAALRRVASEYKIPEWRVRLATQRIKAVRKIEPDMDLRDNASVYFSDQHTIYFGTIFLAGLPSDEGMISVIAHELIHIGDGPKDVLHQLFRLVGRRAEGLTGLHINGRRPEELTCDLVGMIVTRSFITRTPNNESLARRLARSVEHNCVDEDDTDEYHLSPRNTLRALLMLDATLGRDIIGDGSPAASPPNTRHQQRPRATSLTTSSPHFYHHLFR